MAPSVLQLSTQLRQIVYYHLDNDLLQNALFLAERMHGLDPRSSDALHLLALCHYRLGEYKMAYDYIRPVAQRGGNLGCSYVFAQVCLNLKKNAEGISALERARPLWEGRNMSNKNQDNSARRYIPDAAAVHCLLGKLLQADREIKRAVDCYVEALKLNPFMWDAFERLCDTGANIRTSNIFKISAELLSIFPSSSIPHDLQEQIHDQENAIATSKSFPEESQVHVSIPAQDPFTSSRPNAEFLSRKFPGREAPSVDASQMLSSMQREAVGVALDIEPPNAPGRKPRNNQLVPGASNEDLSRPPSSFGDARRPIPEDPELVQATTTILHNQHKRTISGSISQNHGTANNTLPVNMPQRRSRRLFGKPSSISSVTGIRDASDIRKAKAPGPKARVAAISTVGRVVSGNRKPIETGDVLYKETRPQVNSVDIGRSHPKMPSQVNSVDIEALQWLLDLLERLGNGYCASSRYQCQAALQHYLSIPQLQRETAWVMAQVGKTLHEQTKYTEAERIFSRLRKKVPSRMRDMEVYSIVLWHLKSDTELAFLAHELVDAERSAPQAWCTIGNSFSLQRDHDQALKCFRRATQLDPAFAYGFTLQGHEYSANEEYEKALQAYRRAISADHRHYNGWYGLARVYEKLGKYDMAVEHYKAAASINPTNAVLVWSIGMVLEKQKKPQAALAHYKHACELAPTMAMPRFKKARVLLSLQRPEEALVEFNILKDMVPDESNVHYMLGRVHKQLRNKSDAVKHFTIALNLDPKAAPWIKEAMETIDQAEEDMSEDDEDQEMS